MAEGVGFEPTDGLPHLLISRAMLKPQIIAVSLYFYNLVLVWCYFLNFLSSNCCRPQPNKERMPKAVPLATPSSNITL